LLRNSWELNTSAVGNAEDEPNSPISLPHASSQTRVGSLGELVANSVPSGEIAGSKGKLSWAGIVLRMASSDVANSVPLL